MFGHWFEILVLLGLALLVFGPKRLIEMGSQLGKTFRELQASVKEMNWSSLVTSEDETASTRPTESVASKLSQFSQSLSAGQAPSRPLNPLNSRWKSQPGSSPIAVLLPPCRVLSWLGRIPISRLTSTC
jgi:TatA/E family protein of Tat protein translocase